MTDRTNLAAALLRDVPRFASPDGNLLAEEDVLAALSAALDPALSERAGAYSDRLRSSCFLAFDDGTNDYGTAPLAADLLTALLAQNAELRAERDETYAYAKHLVEAIFANGKFDAPQWKPLEDTLGVLTQIDNMVAGIRACAEAAEAAEAREERLRGALSKLHHAVCGETGFAACVRLDSGKAYPWPALDDADEAASAALTETATTEERK